MTGKAQELSGKVAIVTGASAGTGRAYALALAGEGATVIAAARSVGHFDGAEPARNTLAEVVKAGEGLPGRIFAQKVDLEIEEDIARMVEQTIANFGRIDVLVNNAGVYPQLPTLEISCDDWDWHMRVNVRGPYLTMRHVAPHMIRQGSGSIINLSTASAHHTVRGHPGHAGFLAYSVSKAALNRLSDFMAEELEPYGIAVNAMSPGAVLTDTWKEIDPAATTQAAESGWGKPPTPEVMGPALLYLAKQNARTMTGQLLHNDTYGKTWPTTD